MSDFYAYWSVYDHERETSLPLYRAVLIGKDKASATRLAKRLIPRVVRHHNAQDVCKVEEAEVEMFIQPLEEWIDKLKQLGEEIQKRKDDE